MKKLFFALIGVGMIAFGSNAQIKTPAPSPTTEITQDVGLTEVWLQYSRPGVKDRTIFGDLVPYGEVWRTGANKASQFKIDTDIKVEGKDLKKGHYAIFTVPNKDSWDVIFYEETEIWGTPDEWVDSLEAVRVTVKTASLNDMVESFTISIDNVSNGKTAEMNFSWEKTKVTVMIETPANELAEASIDKVMAGPGSSDYYRAASYYYTEKKDMKQAYEWIKKACEMRGEEAYWYFRRKSLIEAELGMFKEAIATAEISMKNAKAKGNEDYVKMNEDSIAEWKKK